MNQPNYMVLIAALAMISCGGGEQQSESLIQDESSAGGNKAGVDEAVAELLDTEPAEVTLNTQKRVNRYFHESVAPSLVDCWSRIEGEGAVTFEYRFHSNEDDASWVFGDLSVAESSLTEDATLSATRCMKEATTGSSFAAGPNDVGSTVSYLYWTWPAPLPDFDREDVAAMMAAGGSSGGGCDGHGAAKKCWTCKSGSSCQKVCVGYKRCSIIHDDYPLPHCSASGGHCASGGPFGLAGLELIH